MSISSQTYMHNVVCFVHTRKKKQMTFVQYNDCFVLELLQAPYWKKQLMNPVIHEQSCCREYVSRALTLLVKDVISSLLYTFAPSPLSLPCHGVLVSAFMTSGISAEAPISGGERSVGGWRSPGGLSLNSAQVWIRNLCLSWHLVRADRTARKGNWAQGLMELLLQRRSGGNGQVGWESSKKGRFHLTGTALIHKHHTCFGPVLELILALCSDVWPQNGLWFQELSCVLHVMPCTIRLPGWGPLMS